MFLPTNTFSWVGDDLNIDLSALPVGMDLDGPGGFEDLDGDGVFDDLAGGNTVSLSVFLGVDCGVDQPDPTSAICPSNDCSFSQFYIDGRTNCGTPFREFPSGISGFDIIHGATSVTNPNEVPIPLANPSLSGYDFGTFGNTGASTQEIEFCYEFESQNFNACTDSDIFLQITFAGPGGYVYDIDILDASISVDGGAFVDANLAADTTWTNVDDETRVFMLDVGDAGGSVCLSLIHI